MFPSPIDKKSALKEIITECEDLNTEAMEVAEKMLCTKKRPLSRQRIVEVVDILECARTMDDVIRKFALQEQQSKEEDGAKTLMEEARMWMRQTVPPTPPTLAAFWTGVKIRGAIDAAKNAAQIIGRAEEKADKERFVDHLIGDIMEEVMERVTTAVVERVVKDQLIDRALAGGEPPAKKHKKVTFCTKTEMA
jgi:hypothetical protein